MLGRFAFRLARVLIYTYLHAIRKSRLSSSIVDIDGSTVVDLTNREQLNKKSGKESREERVQRRELISKLVSKRCFRDKIWRQNSLELAGSPDRRNSRLAACEIRHAIVGWKGREGKGEGEVERSGEGENRVEARKVVKAEPSRTATGEPYFTEQGPTLFRAVLKTKRTIGRPAPFAAATRPSYGGIMQITGPRMPFRNPERDPATQIISAHSLYF